MLNSLKRSSNRVDVVFPTFRFKSVWSYSFSCFERRFSKLIWLDALLLVCSVIFLNQHCLQFCFDCCSNCTKKWSFPLRISWVNVTKSAVFWFREKLQFVMLPFSSYIALWTLWTFSCHLWVYLIFHWFISYWCFLDISELFRLC